MVERVLGKDEVSSSILDVGSSFFAEERSPMARGNRALVTLECKDCKRRNYHTNKNKRTTPDKLEMNKYCKWCHKHTSHKETK